MPIRKPAALRLLASLIAATALPVLAEDTARKPNTEPPTLDTVYVTAQRRTESLQSVPVSISVIDGQTLRDTGVRSLEDLGAAVPGLVTTNNVNYGQAPLSIRGVGGANGGGNVFSDEPVAVYLNDVPVSKVRIASADLVDIESVQVLRGPQGTLYGRNATAGAVLLTTAAPTADFRASVLGSYSSLNESRIQAVLSGPVNPAFLGRLAIGYSNRAGWATNSVNGQRLDTSRDMTARTSWRWNASDSFTADLIADYQSSVSRPVTFALSDLSQLVNPAPPNLVAPYVLRTDVALQIEGTHFAYNLPTESRLRNESVTLKFKWNLGALELNSISGWRSAEVKGSQDSDATALDVISNDGRQFDLQWSQEFRLANSRASRFSWLAGAFLYRELNKADAFTIRNQFGFLGAGTAARFDAGQTLSAWGLFADATLRVTDRFSVVAGGRSSGESKDFRNLVAATSIRTVTAPAGVLAPVPVTVPAGSFLSGPTAVFFSDSWKNFSPRVVLEFELAHRLLSYASWSKGFKSGGFNAFGTTPAFSPETIKAIELGLKAELAEGRAIVNAAIFDYDYADLQVRLPVPTGGVDIRNAAAAKVHGAELEATLRPFDSLKLQGSVAWLNASFAHGTLPSVPSTFTFGPSTVLGTQDITNNRLSRAPEWQYLLSATYTRPLAAWGTLGMQVHVRHQSEELFLETQQSSQTFRGDAWSELGIRLGVTPARGRWEVALTGQNILNDRHVTQVAAYGGLPVASVNEPARWAVQLKMDLP